MSRDRALLQIGEVAERVDLSLRTVRYYEEVGLLTPSARSEGGFRLYSATDIDRLLQIKGMKPFGLSLDEMRELLELLDVGTRATASRDALQAARALAQYAQRGDDGIERLERDVAQARKLRLQIGERIGRCLAIAGTESANPGPA